MEGAVTINDGEHDNIIPYFDPVQTLEEYILPEDGFFNIVSFSNEPPEDQQKHEEYGLRLQRRSRILSMNTPSLTNATTNMTFENGGLHIKNGVVKRKPPPKPPRRSRSDSSMSGSGASTRSDSSSSQNSDR